MTPGKRLEQIVGAGARIAQAEAWLAICALSKSLDTEPETDPEIWSRAISSTEEWRNILT